MKYIKSLLFISVAVSLTVFTAHAAPPKVSNVTAKQREGTKLVDITYDLALDAGQTAYVEAWFSYDNGLSFPISAKNIEGGGPIGAGVDSGENHALVWDAGIDWNQKFTATGKIRIIATYGLQPSGLLSGHAIGDSSLVRVEWSYTTPSHPLGQGHDYTELIQDIFRGHGGILDVILADPAEITNAKWNEVVEWALAHNYDGLSKKDGDDNLPVVNITYFQALKWCNARSEMEGLEPAYYLDHSEVIGDLNGDGIINEDHKDPLWNVIHDHNGNKILDEDEHYADSDGNGKYTPREWWDLNNDGVKDYGRTQVYRTGTEIPDFTTKIVTSDGQDAVGLQPNLHRIKWDSQGYRLPESLIQDRLAGIGDETPPFWSVLQRDPHVGAEALYNESMIVASNSHENNFTQPSPSHRRGTHTLGLKDMLGNVAELSEDILYDNNKWSTLVYGGSFRGINSVGDSEFIDAVHHHNAFPVTNPSWVLLGPLNKTTDAIGFRCVRYK